MEFVVATNNPDKLAEMRRILQAAGHTAIGLAEAGIHLQPEETGQTFAENALIKAKAICQACNRPTLGDDSGLMVDALDGAPGVYSARFAGTDGDTKANNRKLLELMERVPFAKRGAQFVCVVALVMPDGSGMQVEGRCKGCIGFSPIGEGGFGYDPLFIVKDKSFAQMTSDEKDQLSHRSAALKRLVQELPGFLKNTGQL